MKEYRRILLVDDNRDIHEDFHKILDFNENQTGNLSELEGILFDNLSEPGNVDEFNKELFSIQLDDAYQGDEAILKVDTAAKENNPYILIFMDVRMPPGIDGIEAIYRIWRKYPFIEIVICSAYSDYSWDEIVNKLGVTDKLLFLKKPFNSVELRQITFSLVKKWNMNHQVNLLVQNLKNEIQQRTRQLDDLLLELRDKDRELSEVAGQDSITGLMNHTLLHEQLNALYSESKRHKFPFAVILIDVDDFEELNSHYGEQAGNIVLREISRILTGTMRLYDITMRCSDSGSEILKKAVERLNLTGRFGGDEFIVIVPHCNQEGAVSLAERVQEKIKAIKLEEYPEIAITTSIGISILEKNVQCSDTNALIKLVDQALHISRTKGKGQISYLSYK